ncbi:DNRLRE domain-containing protein [Paenibacillus sp. ACRRX]|uniref:CBM96 family carbohydrate-binding protein n=1 Tax=Paenibacillus sp. ACRRX TaxID=2918206 RepID=UPI001EF43AF3|nr:DNRLRE domain-containing protein [Paenibacillus sp. ACRRX]MCG7406371.1 DNRLRE domain-containing protein [Paenibacillus sp. ACRRX]
MDHHDIDSTLFIRTPSNKMVGTFKLYGYGEGHLNSSLLVTTGVKEYMDTTFTVQQNVQYNLHSTLKIQYKGENELNATLEVIGADNLSSTIDVRPHNQMYVHYELMPAPRKHLELPIIADATTRSRADLQTINYGDMQRMMIGKERDEEYTSFVDIGNLKERITDLYALEQAKLRIYYAGALTNKPRIHLQQPNTIWRELGVTYANQPYAVELLQHQYTVNKQERYIEFDILDVCNRYISQAIPAYGFLMESPDDTSVHFYTRESKNPPLLIAAYISNAIYSIGRSHTEATVFINGTGRKEIVGKLTIKSNYGATDIPVSLYVHRPEVPLHLLLSATLSVTHLSLPAQVTCSIPMTDDIASYMYISEASISEQTASLTVSKRDLTATVIIDPNAFLSSYVKVARWEQAYQTSCLGVNVQDLHSCLVVSNVKQTSSNINAVLTVKLEGQHDASALLGVCKPDIPASITIRVQDKNEFPAFIHIPHYDSTAAMLNINKLDLSASIGVIYSHYTDAFIQVYERKFLDSTLTVHQISQIDGQLTVHQIQQVDSSLTVSKLDLSAHIHPRVTVYDNLPATAQIRVRDVSDLHCSITIKGMVGAYYYIM